MTQKYLVGLERLHRKYSSFPACPIKSRRLLREIVFPKSVRKQHWPIRMSHVVPFFFNWTSA